MSRALRMATCIEEVKDTVKKIDDQKQICEILVTAMSTMDSAAERAHYFDCFKENEKRRNAAITCDLFWWFHTFHFFNAVSSVHSQALNTTAIVLFTHNSDPYPKNTN